MYQPQNQYQNKYHNQDQNQNPQFQNQQYQQQQYQQQFQNQQYQQHNQQYNQQYNQQQNQQQYQQQCRIIFDISFNTLIKCIDDDLLEIYLNIVMPNPQSLSLVEIIKCANLMIYKSTRINGTNNIYVDNYMSNHHHIMVCTRMCRKLLKYGVFFDYDESVNKINNHIKMLLNEKRQNEIKKKTNILLQYDCLRKIPKELIIEITDFSIPHLSIHYKQ